MTGQVERIYTRVMAIPWSFNFDDFDAKSGLAREFLRRLKLWERAVGVWPGYPFGDLAKHVAPTARADEALTRQLHDAVLARAKTQRAADVAVAALQMAAAEDAGALTGFNLPRLFVPLLAIYELGGTFQTLKGYFEVDLGAFRLGERDWANEPALSLPGDE